MRRTVASDPRAGLPHDILSWLYNANARSVLAADIQSTGPAFSSFAMKRESGGLTGDAPRHYRAGPAATADVVSIDRLLRARLASAAGDVAARNPSVLASLTHRPRTPFYHSGPSTQQRVLLDRRRGLSKPHRPTNRPLRRDLEMPKTCLPFSIGKSDLMGKPSGF